MPKAFKDHPESGDHPEFGAEVPARKSSSADIPTYDMYPAGPAGEAAIDKADHLLPERKLAFPRRGNPQLNSVAEAVGGTLGRMQRQLTVVAGRDSVLHNRAERAKDAALSAVESAQLKVNNAVDDWKERAKGSIDAASAQSQEMIEQLRRNAREHMETARATLSQAGINVRRAAKEQPVQVIAGAFVAGIALGVLLKIWRNNNA